MANSKQAATKRLNMAERAQLQMDLHFPGLPAEMLWRRKANDGFTTLPRSLPIVMQAIDMQSKGTPAGHTLFCLWARSPDHPFITIENATTFAAEAGFVGERAVDTWRKRMKYLRDLGMIVTKPGPTGDFHYVLLLNPNTGLEWLRLQGKVQDGVYSRFLDRITEVGAYSELEAIRSYWATQKSLAASQAKAEAPNSESSSRVPLPAIDAPPLAAEAIAIAGAPSNSMTKSTILAILTSLRTT
jgi:hypothetical protein